MLNADIGHWYRLASASDPVEVIAIDEADDKIELQHFHGEIESFDFTDWLALFPVEVESPEDWTGPFEMERQDICPSQLFSDYLSPKSPTQI
ncbi:DUF6763 family protein [Pleionea litopenaei]|uniref:Uncharacterized protein n=1 Tax=Pleionea litopenaei TaxID=3070815 RepID=A0AA51RVE6_9GAMM|nr:DUF6763 family protein [Pleionea sp. HL-JVS1]WMS88322.1 hypothetical protein Q9312_05235 [Pleionea sp. HL-JVS1]